MNSDHLKVKIWYCAWKHAVIMHIINEYTYKYPLLLHLVCKQITHTHTNTKALKPVTNNAIIPFQLPFKKLEVVYFNTIFFNYGLWFKNICNIYSGKSVPLNLPKEIL